MKIYFPCCEGRGLLLVRKNSNQVINSCKKAGLEKYVTVKLVKAEQTYYNNMLKLNIY